MPEPYQLKNMYNLGQYEQVAAFRNDPDEVRRFSEWDFFYCANSLYKLGRYQECRDLCRVCSEKYPDFRMLDDKVCWCIYQTEIKNFDFRQDNIQTLLNRADYIFEHSGDSRFSPRWWTAKFIAKANEDDLLHVENGYALVSRYLEKVNPDTLDTAERVSVDESGKSRRLASDRESWYSKQSKALLKINAYDACIACCDRGLKALTGFHSNNDSWMRYRKAKCMQALGKPDEAEKYVVEILKSGFSHWCLLQLMFEFEAEKGNHEKALTYAGACCLSDEEHKMRVGFYEDLADHLAESGETELAMLLRRLVLLLRAENEWRERNYQGEWRFTDEINAMDKQAVLDRLNPVWREWRDKDKVYLTGKICKLLAEGKSGFIEADNGGSYYFNARDMKGRTREPRDGMRVRFTLTEKMDKSKGIVKQNAVEITVL